jgi:lysozyme
MDIDILKAELARDEGCVLHAYQDSESYWTIGIGRLIDKRRGGGITEDEAAYLLSNDIARIAKELDRHIPWWSGLPEPKQRALANLAFQLGVGGLLGFRKMLAALQAGEWEKAASEALDSTWAVQTPARAGRIAAVLRA